MAAPLTVLKFAGDGRRFRAVASTGAPDRHGDIVEPGGWRLDSYRKNPVVLLAHGGLPVARATHVAVERQQLVIEAQFPPAGTSAESDQAYALIEAGLLAAVSVGFVPLRSEPLANGRGWRFLEQELLELSIVAVPANPQALIEPPLLQARSAGPSAAMAAKQAEMVGFRRLAVPERAARVATAARKAGRPRLARCAADLARHR
ncbi:MAG: HK97 family phage prohead protease [Geminicoccaceae bacterium]